MMTLGNNGLGRASSGVPTKITPSCVDGPTGNAPVGGGTSFQFHQVAGGAAGSALEKAGSGSESTALSGELSPRSGAGAGAVSLGFCGTPPSRPLYPNLLDLLQSDGESTLQIPPFHPTAEGESGCATNLALSAQDVNGAGSTSSHAEVLGQPRDTKEETSFFKWAWRGIKARPCTVGIVCLASVGLASLFAYLIIATGPVALAIAIVFALLLVALGLSCASVERFMRGRA